MDFQGHTAVAPALTVDIPETKVKTVCRKVQIVMSITSTAAAPVSPSVSSASPAVSSGFIIGPMADCLFIIGAPLLALVIAGPLFALPSQNFVVSIRATPTDLRQILIVMFINAHLLLVYFRSHANQNIFRTYPLRFTVVPFGLFVAGVLSPVVLGIAGLVGVWWDVYHSSMQTFGFGRIYDAKQKNPPALGRRLDYWMNLLIYLGPVLAGAHFIDHLNICRSILQPLATEGTVLDELIIQRTPGFLMSHQLYLAAAILIVGIPFVGYYLFTYYRLQKDGYHVSWQKVWLLIITASVSIYCWGFRSFIDAFWVMNFFHALQYFAIVLFAEKKNLIQLFRVSRFVHGGMIAAFWVVSFCLLYGWCSKVFENGTWTMSLLMTTSLMHYWYDGFIWSVQKKQV
jgi:hypothetical protein